MRTIKLTVQYDGTDYHGWQRQPNQMTVQETLERALQRVLQERVSVVAAGRTDAGVHAAAQVAHLKTESLLNLKNIQAGTNANLPPAIRLLKIEACHDSFHALHSAKRREYRYYIFNASHCDILWQRYALHYPYRLDIHHMRRCARVLIGTHDFSSFAASGDVNISKVRRIFIFRMIKKGPLITIIIKAGSFLQHQVRTMVGTLLDYNKNRLMPASMRLLLSAKDRTQAGPTAKPHGLWLWRITY